MRPSEAFRSGPAFQASHLANLANARNQRGSIPFRGLGASSTADIAVVGDAVNLHPWAVMWMISLTEQML
ncbi:hypothetical protein WAI453_007732 [Rhynchosporium graminicola]